MHKAKVGPGCQWAVGHFHRPRTCWEGPCRVREIPLNSPFPRQTAQAIWFRGKFKTT